MVLTLVACASGVGACAGEDETRSGFTVRDSAGITIVTNLKGGRNAIPTWPMSREPVIEIGVEQDGPTFFRVTAVALLRDRRVVVGTNTPPEARVFNSTGRVVGTLGGPGEGPGEFSTVTSVVPFAHDSIAVWDENRLRLSVFTPEGELIREVDLSELVLPSPVAVGNVFNPAAFSHLLHSTSASHFVFQVGAFGPGSGVHRAEASSYRITTEGEALATFGPFPGWATYRDEMGLAPYPFGTETYGVALHDTLVIGTAERSELHYYGPDGTPVRVVRWPEPDRTVAGPRLERWTEWLDTVLAEMPPQQADVFQGVFESMPQPERFPAYADLLVSDRGEIWVGDYPGQLGLLGLGDSPPRMPQRSWQVLGADGLVKAMVATPEGFVPHAVLEGLIWGVFTDELEVESVRAYEVSRTSP